MKKKFSFLKSLFTLHNIVIVSLKSTTEAMHVKNGNGALVRCTLMPVWRALWEEALVILGKVTSLFSLEQICPQIAEGIFLYIYI